MNNLLLKNILIISLEVICFANARFEVFHSGRIFGGHETNIEDVPYQVSLRSLITLEHFCGGSLISPCHVITAAHCDLCARNLCYVGYGSHKLSTQRVLPIERFVPHEEYVLDAVDDEIQMFKNDIAIIKLPRWYRTKLDNKTNVIELLEKKLKTGTKASIMGWGYTSATPKTPLVLQSTEVSVVDCPAEQSNWFNFVCVESEVAGACPGDSGGPMVVDGKLSGIASFASPCPYTPSSNGYTDISAYVDWVKQKMEEMPC